MRCTRVRCRRGEDAGSARSESDSIEGDGESVAHEFGRFDGGKGDRLWTGGRRGNAGLLGDGDELRGDDEAVGRG